MEIVALASSFFESDLISGLTINLLSSWLYDKRSFLSREIGTKQQLTIELADVLENTFRKFYEYKSFLEYDTDIVLKTFQVAYSSLEQTEQKGNLRKAIELTIDQSISDEDFARWAEYFYTFCAEKTYLFRWISKKIADSPSVLSHDDDMVFSRIEAKLLASASQNEILPQHRTKIDSVFEKINDRFQSSWKNDCLSYFPKLTRNPAFLEKIQEIMSFIRSNEDCDLVLAQLENLLSMYDMKKSNREAYRSIQEFLQYPHYDMLKIISGTSGSGKSTWIEQYFRFSLEKYHNGALSVVPVLVSCQAGINSDQLRQIIYSQVAYLLGENYSTKEETNRRLQRLDNGVKICFIIENIHIALNSGLKWDDVVSIIKEYSCFDSFRWMITINEYELFLLETDPEFLKKYCIVLSDESGVSVSNNSFSKYALSIDLQNHNWGIVQDILLYKLGIDTNNHGFDIEKSISTPMEAKTFCDCLGTEDLSMISLPSTYFAFFTIIAEQKNKQLQNSGISLLPATIDQVANSVMETHKCVIDPQSYNPDHLNAIRNEQLLVLEKVVSKDIYSQYYFFPLEQYKLSIMAYWARLIAGKLPVDEEADISIVNFFPMALSEWLIPCYIFRCVDNKDILSKLLPNLKNNNLLDFALFLARRTTESSFTKDLSKYILENQDYIRNARNCYAVLYFVNFSNDSLSIPDKFHLLMAVSKPSKENGLLDIYERVFQSVVGISRTCKKLKKNMLLLSSECIPDINYINGYLTADVLMKLWKDESNDYDKFFHDYVIYLFQHNELIQLIREGNNNSFMDYFIRRCMENYINIVPGVLLNGYSMLDAKVTSANEVYSHKQKNITGKDVSVIRRFYRRNFTCAAGNMFSRKGYKPTNYENQYVSVVEALIQTGSFRNKQTAWHLLSNSKNDKDQVLDIRLERYAKILENDHDIQKWLGSDRSKQL